MYKRMENGITLIALVVTIIVLLILAAISINLVLGDNGIVKKTQEARIKSEIGKEQEIVSLSVMEVKENENFEMEDESKLKKAVDSYLDAGESEVINNKDGSFLIIFPSNRGYEVDIDGNINVIEDVEKPEHNDAAVARINYRYYEKLQDAINAVPDNKAQTTIVMLKDISENVIINENKNIVLDLREKSITNLEESAIITLSGQLIIKDGTLLGTYSSKIPTIYSNENSILSIENAIIDRKSSTTNAWETIQLYGTLNMNSGKINSPNSNAICTYENSNSIININGGLVYSREGDTIYNVGILNINGGTITCSCSDSSKSYNTIANDVGGIAVISGGTINTENIGNGDFPTGAIYNAGNIEIKEEANISGGMAVWPALYNTKTGTTVINGGYIYSYGCTAITNYGTLQISDGYVKSRQAGNSLYATLVIRGGSVSALGGTIEHMNNYCAIYKESSVEATVVIDGCNIIGTTSI